MRLMTLFHDLILPSVPISSDGKDTGCLLQKALGTRVESCQRFGGPDFDDNDGGRLERLE